MNRSDGLAIVYQYVNQQWVQVGQNVTKNMYTYGSHVELVGTRLVVSAYLTDSVFVYDFVDGQWMSTFNLTRTFVPSIYTPPYSFDRFGEFFQLSADGSKMVVGATQYNNGNGNWTGAAYVFQYRAVEKDWVQVR